MRILADMRAASDARGAAARLFDFPDLRVGTMIETAAGAKLKLPLLPDPTLTGASWVQASTADRLVLHDDLRVGGLLKLRMDVEMVRVGVSQLDYTASGTIGGFRLPTMTKRYDVIGAGRGWIELRSATDPRERMSSMQVKDGVLYVDIVGPRGITDTSVHRLVQPGAAGYRPPPAGGR